MLRIEDLLRQPLASGMDIVIVRDVEGDTTRTLTADVGAIMVWDPTVRSWQDAITITDPVVIRALYEQPSAEPWGDHSYSLNLHDVADMVIA